MTEQSKMPERPASLDVVLNMCREANSEARLPTPACWDLALYVDRLQAAVLSIQAEAWNAAIEAVEKKCAELRETRAESASRNDGRASDFAFGYVNAADEVTAAIRTLRKETENHG